MYKLHHPKADMDMDMQKGKKKEGTEATCEAEIINTAEHVNTKYIEGGDFRLQPPSR